MQNAGLGYKTITEFSTLFQLFLTTLPTLLEQWFAEAVVEGVEVAAECVEELVLEVYITSKTSK